jgi:hypothetical protein
MSSSSTGARTKKQLSETLTRNINAYALAAGATGVGILAMLQPAEAEVVFNPSNKVIRINFYTVLDLNRDGTPDFKFNQYSVNYRYFRGTLLLWPNNKNAVMESANGYASVLARGAPIGPGQEFVNGAVKFARNNGFQGSTSTSFKRREGGFSQYFGPWWNVQNKYVGVAFTIGKEIHYGWIRLSLSATYHSFQTTMTGFAYETVAGREIHAGQTADSDDATSENMPMAEPLLGALALGSSGLELWRHEKSELPTQSQ